MPAAYTLERCEPSVRHCDCCGALRVRLTRFVYEDEKIVAYYYVAYGQDHAADELDVMVSLGPWDEESGEAKDQIAFFVRVGQRDDSFEVRLQDPGDSAWPEANVNGERLSRTEAIAHPDKKTAFDVLDHALDSDRSVRGFFRRQACDDRSAPMEHAFGLPDEVFALGAERETRADVRESFVVLDDARFFVRCLLPIPVEHYGTWRIGLWIEVTRADHERIRACWSDAEAYPLLRFSGTVANDVATEMGFPVPLRLAVDLGVRDVDGCPVVVSAGEEDAEALLTQTWDREAFEAYAVDQGYL
jgi:hypothetical protein